MHANGVKFVLVLVLFEHLDPQACADYTYDFTQHNTTYIQPRLNFPHHK